MLYIAAAVPIAEGSEGPLTVAAIDSDLAAKLASTLSLPFRRFVAGPGGCSCDFPSLPIDEPLPYWDGMFSEDSEDKRAHSASCLRSLFDIAGAAMAPGGVVEIYPSWAGHEDLPPKGRIELRVQAVVPQQFYFMERFLYLVRAR